MPTNSTICRRARRCLRDDTLTFTKPSFQYFSVLYSIIEDWPPRISPLILSIIDTRAADKMLAARGDAAPIRAFIYHASQDTLLYRMFRRPSFAHPISQHAFGQPTASCHSKISWLIRYFDNENHASLHFRGSPLTSTACLSKCAHEIMTDEFRLMNDVIAYRRFQSILASAAKLSVIVLARSRSATKKLDVSARHVAYYV